MQVLDAMPSSNLKPEDDEAKLEADRKYRTTYMFSATMPPTVERLAKKYLRRPVTITIGSAGRATDNVTQRVMLIKVRQGPASCLTGKMPASCLTGKMPASCPLFAAFTSQHSEALAALSRTYLSCLR